MPCASSSARRRVLRPAGQGRRGPDSRADGIIENLAILPDRELTRLYGFSKLGRIGRQAEAGSLPGGDTAVVSKLLSRPRCRDFVSPKGDILAGTRTIPQTPCPIRRKSTFVV